MFIASKDFAKIVKVFEQSIAHYRSYKIIFGSIGKFRKDHENVLLIDCLL